MGSRVITDVIDNANYAMSLAYRCSYFSTQFQPTNRAVGCKFLSSSSIQFCNWKVVTESALRYSVLRVYCWVYWWMLVIDRLLPNDSLISQTNETTLSLGHCKYRKARRDTVRGSHTVLTIVWFWSRFIRNDKKKQHYSSLLQELHKLISYKHESVVIVVLTDYSETLAKWQSTK